MIRVLFVCHGNICRSPMAEFVFKDMINKKQLALSLFIGAGLILIKLIKLALASPNDMQLQTVSSLFSMGMWYVPLLFVLLYYFVYSSICYLVLRVITYTLNNVLHK